MADEPFGSKVLERDDMAKAKKGKPVPETPKPLFSVKGLPSWHAWLKEYARFLGLTATSAMDVALREQAKRDGFTKPMPPRFP